MVEYIHTYFTGSAGDSVSCIRTYTGVMFDPTQPDEDSVRVEDIAHTSLIYT